MFVELFAMYFEGSGMVSQLQKIIAAYLRFSMHT